MLLQNPALTGDLETELNGSHEPVQTPPPKSSSSLCEIGTVEAMTVPLLGTPCAHPGCWPVPLLIPRAIPNSRFTAASHLVSSCYLSSHCSLRSSLQPTQGLALHVSICLPPNPLFQEGLIRLSRVSVFHAWILPATTWVAWVLNSVWLQSRT